MSPRFHCLLPVRDEADIIGQCLTHLLAWSDSIYVFDTGSIDNTWEIVQDFAAKDKRIIPLRKDAVYFAETRLRGWMFDQARKQMKSGDWFLRVDADEFHHIAPPVFVKERLRSCETVVYHQYYNFAFRQSEVLDWTEGRETLADRARPIEERRRWYEPSVYAEPRLCRYRETMQWPPSVSFPYNAGYIAVERLPIRHYPHRDPLQMERRCRLRAIMMADKENRSNWSNPELHHWAEKEWRKMVSPDAAPGLKHWEEGTPLDDVRQTNHLSGSGRRMAQRIAHAFLLPFLDYRRPKWPEDAYPQLIPEGIKNKLSQELKEPG